MRRRRLRDARSRRAGRRATLRACGRRAARRPPAAPAGEPTPSPRYRIPHGPSEPTVTRTGARDAGRRACRCSADPDCARSVDDAPPTRRIAVPSRRSGVATPPGGAAASGAAPSSPATTQTGRLRRPSPGGDHADQARPEAPAPPGDNRAALAGNHEIPDSPHGATSCPSHSGSHPVGHRPIAGGPGDAPSTWQ